MVSTLILLQKHVLGHKLGGHTVSCEAWWMIVQILSQLNAALELRYCSGRTFVLGGTFSIAVRTNPVHGSPKTGLLFVHISIKDEIVTLLLVAYEEVVQFLYPNILRQLRYELTGCNRTEKIIEWGLGSLEVYPSGTKLSLKQNTTLGAISLYSGYTYTYKHNADYLNI